MTIQAWTFLISRNQSIDYKTVVAPDFISEAKTRSLLAKASEEDFTKSGRITIREVKGSKVGNLTIVFRSVKARNKDIGEQGNEVLKDPFGREIYWVEGLVFQKDLHEIQHKTGESHLDQAHRELQEKYSEFWYEDKLSVSHVIDLLEITSESDNKFSVLAPLVIARKPPLPEEQEHKNYSSSKLARKRGGMFRVVLIVTATLLLIGISGLWLNFQPTLNSQSMLPSQATTICLHSTKDLQIKLGDGGLSADDSTEEPEVQSSASNSQTSSDSSNTTPSPAKELIRIRNLTELKKNHETALIWINNGSLRVKESLANQIKAEIERQKQGIDNNGIEITMSLDANDTLKIKNHTIDFAIALLQNQKEEVTSGELDVTIVEPISPEQPSCKLRNS